jgi:hypothetical protein
MNDTSTLRLDLLAQTVGVIGFVGEDLLGLKTIDQVVCRRHVVLLPGTKSETCRQTQGIDYGVDFGAEAPA